jgi:hypothetical protein
LLSHTFWFHILLFYNMASSICHIYLFLITFKERKKEKER